MMNGFIRLAFGLILARAPQPARERSGAFTEAVDSCRGASLQPIATIHLSRSGEQDLSSPVDIAIRGDGKIAVFDLAMRAVRVFEADGRPAGRIDGPGVLQMSRVTGMAAQVGSLLLWDAAKQQVIRLPEAGTPSFIPVIGKPSHGTPARIFAEAGLVAVGVRQPTRLVGTFDDYVVLLDSVGQVKKRFGPFLVRTALQAEDEATVTSVNLADDLADRTVWAMLADGQLIAGRSTEPVLFSLGNPQDILVRLPPAQVRVSGDDIATSLFLARPTGIDSAAIRGILPTFKAAIVDIVAGGDWVFVRRPLPGSHLYVNSYDIVRKADYQYCGTQVVGARMMAARGAVVAGFRYSESGAIDAVTFRVVGKP